MAHILNKYKKYASNVIRIANHAPALIKTIAPYVKMAYIIIKDLIPLNIFAHLKMKNAKIPLISMSKAKTMKNKEMSACQNVQIILIQLRSKKNAYIVMK